MATEQEFTTLLTALYRLIPEKTKLVLDRNATTTWADVSQEQCDTESEYQ